MAKFDTLPLGEQVRRIRHMRNLSQAETANEMGINLWTLSKLEVGYDRTNTPRGKKNGNAIKAWVRRYRHFAVPSQVIPKHIQGKPERIK